LQANVATSARSVIRVVNGTSDEDARCRYCS
jgi:hypothetical protein